VEWKAFTGAFGSKESEVTYGLEGRTLTCATTGRLGPGEGVTVNATIPEGLKRPSFWRTWAGGWATTSSRPDPGVGPGLLRALVSPRPRCARHGLDRRAVRAPEGLGPAEVGTLVDERVDQRDISATIVDLAVRVTSRSARRRPAAG